METAASQEMPLRIAVLAAALRTGGGLTVGLNMIGALGRVAPQHEYFFVLPQGLGYEETVAAFPQCQVLLDTHRHHLRRWCFETFTMRKAVRAFRPDVVAVLSQRGMLNPGCPQCIFPQLPHLFYPPRHYGELRFTERLMLRYHKRYFTKQLPFVQLVLVQTPVVERRLRQAYDYHGRTLVCGTSVSPFLTKGRSRRPVPEALRSARDKLKLLYITRYYCHKNLEGIIELFRKHRDALRDVVIVTTIGADPHANAAKYIRAIDEYQLGDQIINVGPVPHQDVGAYYEHCDALFMPTLLETFGIPYLEAMWFDLPLLTSDLDFAHAVCGDAALYFDPWDVASMRDAILRLKSDPELGARLVTAGRKRVRQSHPAWDEIARQALQHLGTLAREHRGHK